MTALHDGAVLGFKLLVAARAAHEFLGRQRIEFFVPAGVQVGIPYTDMVFVVTNTPENHIVGAENGMFVIKRADEFPNDVTFPGHFEQAAFGAFANKCRAAR